jgi:hypothetical protein
MEVYSISQRDHGEKITSTLMGADGNPANLTGATVYFSVSAGEDYPRIVHGLATIIDAVGGRVSYTWQPLDTRRSGTYRGVWDVTYADGSQQSFPNDSYITVNILEDT